jgi:hypothetical protein
VKQRGLGGFPHERLLNPEGATHSVGVVTQITATMRVNSGWSGQYGLLDFSYKPSPFRAGLLTKILYGIFMKLISADSNLVSAFF